MLSYKDIFSEKPGKTNCIEHNIKVKTEFKNGREQEIIVQSKEYRVPQMYVEQVRKELESMLKENIIRKSSSQYSSPLVVVKKKDNTIRLCCDYRKLNSITEIDQEGIENIDNLVHKIGKSSIFTTLDLTRGFWQIPLNESARKYSAFKTSLGLMEWNVMPFGLVNSTATFTRMMRKIIPDHSNIVHYVDDICVFSKDWSEHIDALKLVFETLKVNCLTIAPSKVKIGKKEIEFLGQKFVNGHVEPTDQYQKKILDIKVPTTKRQVRSMLGLFNYYSRFLKDYAKIVRPLINLTKKSAPAKVYWSEECRVAFDTLLKAFSAKPILQTISTKDVVILATDASQSGIGACLMTVKYLHEYDNVGKSKATRHPVCYISRALTPAESKYSTIELECLAIFWSITKFQNYLLGRNFTVMTDHKPLINFNISKINNKRINNYAMKLADFQFSIESISGSKNHIPDILSRFSSDIPN